MIGTVTMNVAIDKVYVVKCENTPGEVMRVAECRYTPGGKGLNVARVVKAVGEDVLATGIVGGHAGQWVQEALVEAQVDCDFEHVEGESRSCINIIEPSGRQTEFLEPGLSVDADGIERFVERFEKIVERCDVITISGSVPRGVDEKLYPRLVAICKAKGKPVLLDTSSKLLIEGVKALPTLIKPNADEIRQLLGKADMDLKDFEAVALAASELHDTGIPYVAVSLGGDGCIVACDKGVIRAYPPKITPVNTTGCGDSMIAGFATGFKNGWDIEKTLAFATAVSAANALELTTGFVDPEKVKKLLNEVRTEWMK